MPDLLVGILIGSAFSWFASKHRHRHLWCKDVYRKCASALDGPYRQPAPREPLHLIQDVTGPVRPDLVFGEAKRAFDRMQDTLRTSQLQMAERWKDNKPKAVVLRPVVQQWRASA